MTLPEGMTLNPSAAHGLETCSPAQIGIGRTNPVTCPAGSKVGTVTIETDLPPHSLAGNVYLGNPAGGPIGGPPFTIYLDAESIYGVSVRLQGQVEANRGTGRLEATFLDNPQLPFSDLSLTFNGGSRAPLANPLACGTGQVESLFTPYTGGPAALGSTPFTTTGCPNPLPFSLSQSTQTSNPERRRLHRLHVQPRPRRRPAVPRAGRPPTLPAGLIGAIPSVHAVRRTPSAGGHVFAGEPDRRATVTAGCRLRTVCLLRARLSDRPLWRRSLRPVDRRPGHRRTLRLRRRPHARGDRRRSLHRAA